MRSYVYGPSHLAIEQINNSSGTITYLHHDQAGSTRLITGSSGKTEATFTYGAYGELTGSTGTATTPLGYDAQYTSTDTGLIYLRNRVYDPTTAQFLTVDPLEQLTRAPYNYVEDNPVNAVDPTGLCGAGSLSEFADCFNPVSSGNLAYQGAVALSNATGGPSIYLGCSRGRRSLIWVQQRCVLLQDPTWGVVLRLVRHGLSRLPRW
jgi:RHS repeat-associated protein